MADADPDWYPDPRKRVGVFRWWTGERWTDLLSADPDAPPPAVTDVHRSVPPSASVKGGHALRNTLVTALVLIVVLGGLTALGFRSAVAEQYPDTTPTSFGAPQTPEQPVEDLVVDEEANTVTLAGRLTATMPGEPWDPSIAYPFSFGRSGATRVAVHEQYRGEENWYGIVTLGILDRQVSQRPDPESTARSVLDATLSDATFFHSPPFQADDVDLRPAEVPGEPDLQRFDVRIPVEESDLPTEYNDLVIILADLGDEKVAAWVEMIPDDIDPALRAAVEESRTTLTVE